MVSRCATVPANIDTIGRIGFPINFYSAETVKVKKRSVKKRRAIQPFDFRLEFGCARLTFERFSSREGTLDRTIKRTNGWRLVDRSDRSVITEFLIRTERRFKVHRLDS